MNNIDIRGTLNAIAEGLRTSTVERFDNQTDPDGNRWKPSIRVRKNGGKTLTSTAALKTSIRAQSDDESATVGTNMIYAATHQFGDKRTIKIPEKTIRAKNGKALRFVIDGKVIYRRQVTVRAHDVHVDIPARPFLGLSREDEDDINELLQAMMEEQK